jgi:hypothetical protein
MSGDDWIGRMRGIVEADTATDAADYGFDERSTFESDGECTGVPYGDSGQRRQQ